MAKKQAATAEARAPLSRERVLRTAMRLADEGGLGSLSMRRLAHELGVEAMSLYYYVPNKDGIFSGLIEMVMSEVEPASAGPGRRADWKAEIRRSASSYHAALQRHPWAHSLMTSPERVSPTQVRYMEALLRSLRG